MTLDPIAIGMAALAAGFYFGLVVLFAGLARIPWRYAAQIALGVGLVVATGSLARSDTGYLVDHGQLVIVAAIGGGIAVRGYERGKARRDAMIEAIVGSR